MILSNENVTKDFYSSADIIKYFVNDKIVEQKWNAYRTPSKEGQLKCILPLQVIT